MSTKVIQHRKPSVSLLLGMVLTLLLAYPSVNFPEPPRVIPQSVTELPKPVTAPVEAPAVAKIAPKPVLSQTIAQRPAEADSHPNYEYHILKSANDTYFAQQWSLSAVNTLRAWDITTGEHAPIVAVIDTGFTLDHPDLASAWSTNAGEMGSTNTEGPAPNCTSRGLALDKRCNNYDDDVDGYKDNWRGWDFVNGDNSPQAGTSNPNSSAAFHGTFVSGIIAARGNNNQGVAGISWASSVMPLQVLSDDGYGYTDTIAAAIRYAADHGAKVINMSLGSTYNDSYMRSAIDYAIGKGAVVVAAAGNDACNCLSYPANYSEVIAVGASDQNDSRASFSSYGANLDIVAPGVGICSTTYPSGYACGGQGTSFAAPHVAGALALLLSQQADTPTAAIRTLTASAFKVAGMSGAAFTTSFGYGRLDIYRMLLTDALPTSPGGSSEKIIHSALNQNVVSVCSTYEGTLCALRLTGPDSQAVTLPSQTANRWGDAIFYWNPGDAGLSTGTWKIESIDPASGQLTAEVSYIVID